MWVKLLKLCMAWGRGFGLQDMEVMIIYFIVTGWQSARIAYLSKLDEIGTEAKLDEVKGQKWNVYSGTRTFCLFDREKIRKSVYWSTHFQFCPSNSSKLASVPLSYNCDFPAETKVVDRTGWGLPGTCSLPIDTGCRRPVTIWNVRKLCHYE